MHGGSHSQPASVKEILRVLSGTAERLRRNATRWRQSAGQGEVRIARGDHRSPANEWGSEKRFVADALERAAELLEQAQDKLDLMRSAR